MKTFLPHKIIIYQIIPISLYNLSWKILLDWMLDFLVDSKLDLCLREGQLTEATMLSRYTEKILILTRLAKLIWSVDMKWNKEKKLD